MKPQTINRVSLLLLFLGFGTALAIFLTAEPAEIDPLGDFRSSKRYQRELKVMGGEANVLVDEFQTWFGNQWHGRELARSVAVLTIGITLFYRLLASHPDNTDESPGQSPGNFE